MKIRLPQYSSKDYQVLLWVMLPFTVLLNGILFGQPYFTQFPLFLLATLITGSAAAIDFICCGFIAVALKNRFPAEGHLVKRITLMILSFWLISGLFLFSLFHGYESIQFYNYQFNEVRFVWSYISMGILNVFITLFQEGIARYEQWKLNIAETDSLKTSYRQSQLQGLKSQVNPHFLFNSLNSLSSLIQEDEATAERFLDEMSKVYRYMLRNDEDHFIDLHTELAFINSYFYLLKARYGDGLLLNINIKNEDRVKLIPPLSLQVIIENAVQQNSINKHQPLSIRIFINEHGNLVIVNNTQPKIVTEIMEYDEGLDILVNKYRLINKSEISIQENETERVITLPLITKIESQP